MGFFSSYSRMEVTLTVEMILLFFLMQPEVSDLSTRVAMFPHVQGTKNAFVQLEVRAMMPERMHAGRHWYQFGNRKLRLPQDHRTAWRYARSETFTAYQNGEQKCFWSKESQAKIMSCCLKVRLWFCRVSMGWPQEAALCWARPAVQLCWY